MRRGERREVLLFSDSLPSPVEAVAADDAHGEEVVGGAEAACGEVALRSLLACVHFPMLVEIVRRNGEADLVLDGLVTAGWGEVLSHGVGGA